MISVCLCGAQLSMNQANDEVWRLARRIGEAQAQPEPSKPTEAAKVNTSARKTLGILLECAVWWAGTRVAVVLVACRDGSAASACKDGHSGQALYLAKFCSDIL